MEMSHKLYVLSVVFGFSGLVALGTGQLWVLLAFPLACLANLAFCLLINKRLDKFHDKITVTHRSPSP